MFRPPIQDILTQSLQHLPALHIETSLRHDIDDLVAMVAPSGVAAVVDDVHTSNAYGDRVFAALQQRFSAVHSTLPQHTKADETALAEIERTTKGADFLVAVGSGTINDLVKYHAHQAGKPYLLFPTAASMNGYVSANASIEMQGKKQSFAATLPLAVLVDLQMLAAAPLRLSQAGLGDSLARPTAQADWLLSHHLTGEEYDPRPYQLIAGYEPEVFGQAEGIRRADMAAIASLFQLLLLSGFGMTIAGSSRPASGAEHMIAHLMHSSDRLHGEEIAVTSVAMAEYQERLLADRRWTVCSGREIQLSAAKIDAACEAIAAIHLSPLKLAAIRKTAGLPESPEALGWADDAYRTALTLASSSRDRVTCLDLFISEKLEDR